MIKLKSKKIMAISITQSAAQRIKTYLQSRGKGIGLRLDIKKTGCNGYAYVVNYADIVEDDDLMFDELVVNIIVKKKIFDLFDGTEIDFVKEGLNESFRFRNPNVTGECGCGESFSIE